MPQRTVQSPIGPIRLSSERGMLSALRIDAAPEPNIIGDEDLMDEAARQLDEYFAGKRRNFDLPLVASKTVRGAALRAAISGIGHGKTLTYGALAKAAASGPRAIGQACARNPLPILIPCHRVVGSDGLGHYSGGDGIATKQWLLTHEAQHG